MKIKLKTLEEIFKYATGSEIDFIIYIARFQDKFGYVRGITTADACKAIKVHRSYFNAMIHSLEDKRLIEVDWSNEHFNYWNFKILNNVFYDDQDLKEGYINLNTTFLYWDAFLDLKKNEKIIMLTVLARFRIQRNFMTFSFEKIMEWVGVSLRSVTDYVKNLKEQFFPTKMTITSKKVIIDVTGAGLTPFDRVYDETDYYNEHEVDTIIKDTKASVDEEDKKSVVQMFKQFKKPGREIIVAAILACIKNQDGKIIAPYVNKMIHILYDKECNNAKLRLQELADLALL